MGLDKLFTLVRVTSKAQTARYFNNVFWDYIKMCLVYKICCPDKSE